MSLSTNVLPTSYEYYIGNGITSGLSDNQSYFTLNEKNITIYSGAFHYFRVPRAYWRDRLRKMRAAGLNTVETYIPWNLHEPISGQFDFGEEETDMSDFLHIKEFLKTAQEEDLFALVRPGPYICAEFEFGGLPSWLLRNLTTSVRSSSDPFYLLSVKRYFNVLLPILALLQFQKGGPILGFQVENEFGSLGIRDPEYLQFLKQLFLDNGIVELLYTADGVSEDPTGSIPGVLQTANVGSDVRNSLNTLNLLQKNKPTMVMETYPGWFDHWGEEHQTTWILNYIITLRDILQYPASFNMYMFVGSTSYGFLNGANDLTDGMDNSGLQFTTNSYDYDAPLTEYGAYTSKYDILRIVLLDSSPVKTFIPEKPGLELPVAYPDLTPVGQILLSDIINSEDKILSNIILPMEMLDINNNSGQSYGYIVYRKSNIDLPEGAVLKITGYVRDTVLVFLNGKLISSAPKNINDLKGFGFWIQENSTLILTNKAQKNVTLDLVVENFGRNNYGNLQQFMQYKGLTDEVYINNDLIVNWEIVPLEFKAKWNNNLTNWKPVGETTGTPSLYKFILDIDGDPKDTFIDMSAWTKGITIVNGFVLSRHFFIGPQLGSYLPAPLLKSGNNIIIVFEHYDAPKYLKFSDHPVYGNINRSLL